MSNVSLLRRVISIPRPHRRVFHAAQFDFDLAITAVAGLVGGVIAEAVLRADFVGDLRAGGAGLLQSDRLEISATARPGVLVHLTAREVIELATDVHALELPQLTKVLIVLPIGRRQEQTAEALQLFGGQRQTPVVLTILQQAIFDVVFGAY